MSFLKRLFRSSKAEKAQSTPQGREPMVHVGDGWDMPRNVVLAAINRSDPHSLAYHGPIDENGLVDPWDPPRPVDFHGLMVPAFGTRTNYVTDSKQAATSHAWDLCAAELVLANQVENWSDFFGADVKYAISSLPPAQQVVLVWVWFNAVHRDDNCFIFALDTNDLSKRAWLQFLWRSKKLAIRNGPKASGTTNVCVIFEQGSALDFLREKVGHAAL
jgi:hypothetical protein